MLDSARQNIKTLVPKQARVLLAFSGGVDSVVLLQLLLEAGLKPALVHCNFQLRGKESDADEDFARKTAVENHLEFFTERFDTALYSSKNKLSTQMAAREMRYSYFDLLLQQNSFEMLLTAHHLDDSIETFLINFGRGTGIKGLTGITNQEVRVVRPLLETSKTDIRNFARKQGLNWREDSSNAQTDYQRNQLRHQVIPALKESFANLEQAARQSFTYVQEESQALHYFLTETLKDHLSSKDGYEILNYSRIYRKAFWPALIHHWLQPYGNFDWPSLKNIGAGKTGSIYTSEDYEILQDRNQLMLRKRERSSQQDLIKIEEATALIEQPVSLQMEFIARDKVKINPDPMLAFLDAEKLEFPLTLRLWQPGDVFRPLGMKGFKKISDFLIDQRMSRFDKERQWVLCSGTNIAWVLGQRIDDRYKLNNSTKTIYFVRLLKY